MSQQPGQYINYLAVRNLVPLREQDLQYNSSTVFAINEHGIYTGYKPEQWFSTIGYTNPSMIEGKIVQVKKDLQSTVAGLGSAGYISTATLASTVEGLSVYTPISITNLRETVTSTATGLASIGYVSTAHLESTVRGLGSAGYLSSMDGSLRLRTLTTSSLNTSSISASSITIMDGDQPVKIHSANGVLHYGSTVLGRTTRDISANTLNAINLYSETLETDAITVAKSSGPLLIATTHANKIHYSDNEGDSWTDAADAPIFESQIYSILHTPDAWIAYGKGTRSIKYSTDRGASWTDATGSFYYDCLTIAYSDTILVAGGRDAVSGSGITLKYSTDRGASWHNAEQGQYLHKVNHIFYNGSIWIAAGLDNQSLKYSRDGINWGNCIGTHPINPKTIAYNGTIYLAGGDDCIVYSKDGAEWHHSIDTIDCRKIIWNTSHFLIITGEDLKTTTDGKIYESKPHIFQDIFFNGSAHFAIDDQESILKSTDLQNWSKIDTPFSNVRSIESKEDHVGDITTDKCIHYSGNSPQYHHKNNQIFYSADKIIVNKGLTVTKSGKIGIHRQDPTHELDIAGTVRADHLITSAATINDNTFEIKDGSIIINTIPIVETAIAGLGTIGYVSTATLDQRFEDFEKILNDTYTKKEDTAAAIESAGEAIRTTINQTVDLFAGENRTLDNKIENIVTLVNENKLAGENKYAELKSVVENNQAENRTAKSDLLSSIQIIENKYDIVENKYAELKSVVENNQAENQTAKSDLLSSIQIIENKWIASNTDLLNTIHSTTVSVAATSVNINKEIQIALENAITDLQAADAALENKIENQCAETEKTVQSSFQSTIHSIVSEQDIQNKGFSTALHQLQNTDFVLKTTLDHDLQSAVTNIENDYNQKLNRFENSVAENNLAFTSSPDHPKIIITQKENQPHIFLAGSYDGIYLDSNKIYDQKNNKIQFINNKINIDSATAIQISAPNTSIMGNINVGGEIQANELTIVDKLIVGDKITIGTPLVVAKEIAVGSAKIDVIGGDLTINNGNAITKLSSDGCIQLGESFHENPEGLIGIGVESPTANLDIAGSIKINGVTSYSAAAFGTISRLADFKGKNIKAVDYMNGIWTITLVEPLPHTSYSVVVGLSEDNVNGSVLFYESGIKTVDKFQIKSFGQGVAAATSFSFALFI